MKAVDTNVLARFLVDDPDDVEAQRQRPVAIRIMKRPVFVAVTVLLELEWVLRGFYETPRREIVEALTGLCRLENVSVEDRELVLTALEGVATGMDFADALHVARSKRCESFVTFDRTLVRRARRAGLAPPAEPAA
jgi:predicted nucleic-acid-binding protein